MSDPIPNFFERPYKVAKTLCECDGKRWDELSHWQIDRYVCVALVIVDRLDCAPTAQVCYTEPTGEMP
jgi:hypothetical protein